MGFWGFGVLGFWGVERLLVDEEDGANGNGEKKVRDTQMLNLTSEKVPASIHTRTFDTLYFL